MRKPERRESERFNIQLPLSLSISGKERPETVGATAVNISLNGVRCIVDHYLPLFGKILITFVLPEQLEPAYHIVPQCESVVVRIEPEQEEAGRTEYNVALYFNNLSETERNLLQTIISTYTS